MWVHMVGHGFCKSKTVIYPWPTKYMDTLYNNQVAYVILQSCTALSNQYIYNFCWNKRIKPQNKRKGQQHESATKGNNNIRTGLTTTHQIGTKRIKRYNFLNSHLEDESLYLGILRVKARLGREKEGEEQKKNKKKG